MKNSYYILLLPLFALNILSAQNINPTWQFVGPFATNEPAVPPTAFNYNPFHSGQIDYITVDPGNPNHVITSSFFGGIWESIDVTNTLPGGGWHIFPNFDNPLPLGMGCNGVTAVAFRNTNELYATNYISPSGNLSYTNAIFKYDFTTTQWQQLGALPFANQTTTLVNRIVFFPNDPNTIFLCTSDGLVESTDAGVTWFQAPLASPIVGNIHDIVFIEKSTPGTYYWYVSGCDVAGKNFSGSALLMESTDDGATFNNVTQYMNLFSGINSYSAICLGDQTAASGDRDIWIYTARNPSLNGWYNANRQLHQLTKNINPPYPITIPYQTTIVNTGNDIYYNSPARLILGYDATNNQLLLGGVNIHAFNITTKSSTSIGSIHDDYHGIYVNTSVIPNQLYLACDGGFASVSFTGSFYSTTRLNYGLNISLITGFSGASENYFDYVYGQFDESIVDYYEEDEQRVTHEHGSSENDGALIDKFDNDLIITDYSTDGVNCGFAYYYRTTSGASGFVSSTKEDIWNPSSSSFTPQSPTTVPGPCNCGYCGSEQVGGARPFFQDPFHPKRIYIGMHGGIGQFDYGSNLFLTKVRFDDRLASFTATANLTSVATGVYNNTSINYFDWITQATSMSFSQLDKNIMYVVTSSWSGGNPPTPPFDASQVIRYIGGNVGFDLDNVWQNHNEFLDNSNNPLWQLITPDWTNPASSVFYSGSVSDVYHVTFTGVETSNWDKNAIYVSCSSDISPAFPFKVVKFDGTSWSDYSTGIGIDENVVSMVMDHASNDGIYITTEKGIYYRDASMSSWVSYNNGTMHFPYMSGSQLEINYKVNTLRGSTFGRGIWKSDLTCPSIPNLVIPSGTVNGYKEADDISTTNGASNSTPTNSTGSTVFRATNSVTLEPGFTADASSGNNYFAAFIHGCVGGSTSSSNYFRMENPNTSNSQNENLNNKFLQEKELLVFPDPNSGRFDFLINEMGNSQILIYNVFGQLILNQKTSQGIQEIDISNQPKGIYFIKVFTQQGNYSAKIIVQ